MGSWWEGDHRASTQCDGLHHVYRRVRRDLPDEPQLTLALGDVWRIAELHDQDICHCQRAFRWSEEEGKSTL